MLAGAEAGLDHLGLEVEDAADLERLRDALVAWGAEILSETPQELGLDQAIRAVGPMGLVLELYTAMQREPLQCRALHAAACEALRARIVLDAGARRGTSAFSLRCWGFV